MPGFTGIDNIIQRITVDGQATTVAWAKKLTFSPGSADVTWFSTWLFGGFPGAGAAPAALGTTYTNDSTGGIVFPDRAPATKHLLTYGAVPTQSAGIGLYDRLVAVGNVSTTSTGVRTVNTPALPRYSGADSVNVLAYLEVSTGGGRPTVNLSSYTNQDGVAGRSGPAFQFPDSSSANGSLVGPLPLQSGDTGVRSVQQLTVTSSAASVIVNVVLLRWIVSPVWGFGLTYNDRDYAVLPPRLTRIYDGATLVPVFRGTGFSTALYGMLQIGWA